METKELKIGMRIRAIKKVGDYNMDNQCGTIVELDDPWLPGIRFDNDIGGHDLSSSSVRCDDGHGWWLDKSFIIPLFECESEEFE